MHNKREILNIDSQLQNILVSEYSESENVFKKMEQNNNLLILSSADLNKLWSCIYDLLKNTKKLAKLKIKENGTASKEKDCNFITNVHSSVIKVTLQLIKLDYTPDVLPAFVALLNSRLPAINNTTVKDEVSSFLEECWKLELITEGKNIKNVLKYLTECSKLSQEHVIRFNDIKHAINSLKTSEDIQNIMKLARENTLLQISEGRDLLIYLLAVEDHWIMGIYNNIRVSLETADTNLVKIYAEIFIDAWKTTPAKREIIETCLENLVYHCLRAKRNIKGRLKLGENLLTFLECFHLQKNNDVKRMICDQYYPFIWPYLKAPGSCVRCNTAEVLFLAYPMNVSAKLSKSNPRLKKNKYLSMQHSAITNLMRDSDETVCAIAVQGVFHSLRNFWNDIPSKVVNEWLNIALEYTKTSNNPEIRKSIFEGLRGLLRNPHSYSNLTKIVPNFVNSIYDSNVNVKLVVLDFFLKMESCAKIHVGNLVPLNSIIECLEMNSHIEVMDLLHKLLWSRISSLKDEKKIIKEIFNAGQINVNVVRKFFLHSKDIVDFENALELLNILLPAIMQVIESLPEKEVSESKRRKPEAQVKKISCENESPLGSNIDQSSVQILLDASALLYLVNIEAFKDNSLNNHVKDLTFKITEKLYSILEKFEDSELSETAIFFLSLIPKNSIENLDEYLEKYKRKLFHLNTSDTTILSILLLLVRWEKIDVLLDLLPSLLNSDDNLLTKLTVFVQFESVNNESEMEEEARMLNLGLRLLQIIVKNDFQCNLMPNYHKNMVHLWENLLFIETRIENKLMNNNFSCLLTENCLKSMFKHYISLIPILHHSVDFKSEIHFSRIITWIQEKIVNHISGITDLETDELAVNILKCVFDSSNNMITEFKVPPKLCCEIIILYSKCLMKRCGIIFVNSALVTILALMKFNFEIFKSDESELVKVAVPSLFVAVMVTLTKYPAELVKIHTNNLKSLEDVIKNMFPLLGQSLDVRLKYMAIIFNTATFSLSKDFKNLNNEQLSSGDVLYRDLPFIAEEIIKIILHAEGFQDLCLDVLNKTYSKYNTMGQLSALMIIKRLIKPPKKSTIKKRKRIKNIIYSIKEQNQKYTEENCFTSDCDEFISEFKRIIIEEILNSWDIS